MSVSPRSSYVEILTRKVLIVLGGGPWGRWDQEGGLLENGISTLWKETLESSHGHFCFMRSQRKDSQPSAIQEAGPHQARSRGGAWTLDFSLQSCEEQACVVSKPPLCGAVYRGMMG